jgi:LDH2 family malate/lactate/ureidoglycolate dehydrogenase
MRISIVELEQRVVATLLQMGVPTEEAVVGAEMCLDAELRAHRSHGVRLIRNVSAEYSSGSDRRAPIVKLRETPVSAQLDGGFHLSWYVHRMGMDIAIEKAREVGVGMVSVRRAGVSGALGYFVERASRQGLVSMVLASTPVTVVAPGTTTPSLGTNPLAIGFPRVGRDPLVLDMATSSIAFNQVLRLRDLGETLPEAVANGPDGAFATDPNDAIDPISGRGRILPFGGHRGYGLALMLELMVSAGVTGRTATDKRGDVILEPQDFSGIYICYRPELLGDEEAMHRSAEELLSEIVHAGGRLPGEQSHTVRAESLAAGVVEVDDVALGLLAEL